MRTQNMPVGDANNYRSIDEAVHALEQLRDIDLAKLNSLAKLRAIAGAQIDWRDLLHEAIERVLDGRRRWPRELDAVSFLAGVMRSIASDWSRKSRSGPTVLHADLPGAADGQTEYDVAPSIEPGPEREVEARRTLSMVRSIFAEDEQVLAIFDSVQLGEDPDEICAKLNISRTQYASAQKRIRRGIDRAFPKGDSNVER